MNDWTSPFGVLLVLLVVLGLLIRRKARNSRANEWPVFPKRVLSDTEQALFRRLVLAMPGHVVLAQVALSQLVGVKKGANFAAAFNRYSRLVADFVLCRRDFSVLAVVELDDHYHDHPRRRDADQRKNEVLQAAGIPVIRLNAAALPSEQELVQLLTPNLPSRQSSFQGIARP